MKPLIIALYFLSISTLYGQSNDKIIFYDENWKQTSEKAASYKRIAKDFHADPKHYHVEDYFISGQKQMEGRYQDSAFKIKHGTFIYYFENGNRKSEVVFKFNRRDGDFTTWYKDGSLQAKGEYIKKSKENFGPQMAKKIKSFFDSTGAQLVKKGKGFYYECVEGTNLCESGYINKGYKHGLWQGYDTLASINFKEVYKLGELESGESTDSLGQVFNYGKVWEAPEPYEGINEFSKYMSVNLRYPFESRRMGVEGIVLIEFKVLLNGSISNINIVKGLDLYCDQEALRVVQMFPLKWQPAKMRGKEIEQNIVIPIRFVL